jgi:hypothetical protein
MFSHPRRRSHRMKPKHPTGPAMTLGNMRELGAASGNRHFDHASKGQMRKILVANIDVRFDPERVAKLDAEWRAGNIRI